MANVLTIVSCFAVLIYGVSCERGCPPPENITPCTCFKQGIYVDLKCRNITDTQDILRVFEEAQRYHFNKFTLADSSLQYLPYTIFEDVEVIYMNFDALALVNFFNQVPSDPGLKEIFLRRVRLLGGWDWQKLSAFTKLERLIMLDIPLGRLSNAFRQNISKKLKKISFEWCQVKKLKDDEFADFLDLEAIEVSHDKINTIKRSMFPSQSKLKEMALEYNRLTSIPEDLFSNMPQLTYVAFKGNLLSVLPEETFKPLMSYLRYLDVRTNPLKCDCRIVWLLQYKHLNLSGKCASPKALNGRDLYFLKPEDFDC